MKRIQTIAAYFIVLVLAGVSSLKSAEPGRVVGKAIIRSVSGTATFTSANGEKGKLKVNMELEAGATISTGPDAFVYLNVNGLLSTVRVASDTTIAISEMSRVGSAADGDTDTSLDLRAGEILGQVKKVSANSRYEIKTPHGVAGIRGTDFNIKVLLLPNGEYLVTFTSVDGQLLVSAIVSGSTVVKVLYTHESWTPGNGDVRPTPLDLLTLYMDEILTLEQLALPNGPPVISPKYPYPTGSPPSGIPSSPHK